jgi:hypothetical protein
MRQKIGIAVSLYDKFDDLAILHDILRHNFEDDYYLSVHCNHPDGREEILEKRDLDIDHYSQGGEIECQPGTQKVMRILNSIKQSCLGAMKESDYVMHLHADAWPMEEVRISDLIEELKETSRKVAVRGKGPTYQPVSGMHIGEVMDQFLLFDSGYMDEISFFDFKLTDPMPHWGIHTTVMVLLLGRVGRSNMYFYSHFEDTVHWDGKDKHGRAVRPSILDEKWGLFHCAVDEFPDNYGRQVQSMRLRQFGLEQGENIKSHITSYEMPREHLINELGQIENKLNRQLKILLFHPESDRFCRMFSVKADYLEKSLLQKVKMLGKNLFKRTYFGANNLFFRFLPFENPAKRRLDQRRCADWPKKDNEIYRETIEDKETPDSIGRWYSNEF